MIFGLAHGSGSSNFSITIVDANLRTQRGSLVAPGCNDTGSTNVQ